MVRAAWLVGCLALCACGPARVSGRVGGQPVGGARDAIFDTVEIDLGPLGEYNTLVVILTDFPEACQVFEEFLSNLEPRCEDRCDDFMATAEEFLGRPEYWATVITAQSNGSFEEEYDYEDDALGDEEFRLDFLRYDAEPLYDAGDCEDACQDGDLLNPDQDDGLRGSLEITNFDARDLVQGTFDVELGGDDRVRGSFTAEWCNTSDWISWL